MKAKVNATRLYDTLPTRQSAIAVVNNQRNKYRFSIKIPWFP